MEEGAEARGAEAAFEAVRLGDADGLRALLGGNPDLVSACADAGASLLHAAAEQDDPEIARILLDAGADIETVAKWGQTALEWAANLGSGRVAELLIGRGAARYHLWTSAALGHLDEVRAAFVEGRVREGAGRVPSGDADLSGWPPEAAFRLGDVVSDAFYIACRRGHVDIARFLLERGADVNARGYFGASALHWAAMEGHEDVVRLLLERGADTTQSDPRFGSTPAGWAREGGHDSLGELLATAGGSEGVPE